jgi:phosphoribosylformylglycinamidine cyclo-ligase
MPDTYLPGVIDVAGCMLGTVDSDVLLDGTRVRVGDRLLGLAGSGLHTNGYSLARRVLAASGLTLGDPLPGGDGEAIGDALLAPHRWYGRALQPLVEQGHIRAMAHVTRRRGRRQSRARAARGLPRVRPSRRMAAPGGVPLAHPRGRRARGRCAQRAQSGLGMVLVVGPNEHDAVVAALEESGETVYGIGDVRAGERAVEWTAG